MNIYEFPHEGYAAEEGQPLSASRMFLSAGLDSFEPRDARALKWLVQQQVSTPEEVEVIAMVTVKQGAAGSWLDGSIALWVCSREVGQQRLLLSLVEITHGSLVNMAAEPGVYSLQNQLREEVQKPLVFRLSTINHTLQEAGTQMQDLLQRQNLVVKLLARIRPQ